MKKLLFLLIVPALLLPAAAAEPPERIVSLAPSVTESLYALGAEKSIAGISVYCPAGTIKKERIGTLWEPNIEKILSLAPDLVIVSKEGNKKASFEKLKKLGITVYAVDNDRNFESICANFTALARRIGKEDLARQIVADARRRVEAAHFRIKGKKPVRVFWEVGAKPLFTISGRSFVNSFNSYAGGENIFDDLPSRYPQVSREEVLKRDPDVILLVTMGDVSSEEKNYWESFPTLSAVKNRKLFIISPDIFTPTPLTFAKGVETISGLLHGQ